MESFHTRLCCQQSGPFVKGTVVLLLIMSPVSGMGLGTWQAPALVCRN